MYLHYHDDHAYLTCGHMRNNILQGSWNEIEWSLGQEMSKVLPELYGSWDAPQRQAEPPTEVNMPPTASSSSSSASGSQPLTAEQRSKITRKHRSKCKYCTVTGHFAKDCIMPHCLCHRTGGDRCSVPKSHSHYHLLTRPICPYVGFHSVAFYRQVERSGISDGEEVNKLAEG